MRYYITYTFIFLIIVLILLTGLGCNAECKLNKDCNDGKACTKERCVSKKCAYELIPDCHVGNGVCEKNLGEDGCSAPQDCGSCTGKEGEYLSYMCDENNRCITDIIGETNETSFSEDISEKAGPQLMATYTFEQPFDIDSSLFNIKIDSQTSSGLFSNIVVNKIQILEKTYVKETKNYETKVLGEVTFDRHLLYKVGVYFDVPLENAPIGESKGEEKTLTLKIFYSYNKLYKGQWTPVQTSYEKTLASPVLLVNPGKERLCPENCDDGNPCTIDSCSAATDYFCRHVVKPDSCCGNYKCDSDENECSCYVDCGYCARDYGKYMVYSCLNNECAAQLKDENVAQPKTLLFHPNFGIFSADMTITFDEPFDLTNSVFEVELEAISIGANIKNIVCKKLTLTEGNVLLGEAEASMSISAIGQKTSASLSPDFTMIEPEEEKKPSITISCEYDQDVKGVLQHQLKSQTQELTTITFVNPQ